MAWVDMCEDLGRCDSEIFFVCFVLSGLLLVVEAEQQILIFATIVQTGKLWTKQLSIPGPTASTK